MNTARVLNYNFDLPKPVLLFRFGKGTKSIVSNAIQPVRKVTVGDSISSGGTDPSGGLIFPVEFLDGTKREVYVVADSGRLLWEEAVFLKAGRKSTDPNELLPLQIDNPNDRVHSSLIDKMKAALAEHNKEIRAAAAARYSQKATP